MEQAAQNFYGCGIKTKARRAAGLYLTLLCGYLQARHEKPHCSFPMHIASLEKKQTSSTTFLPASLNDILKKWNTKPPPSAA